MWLGRHDCVSRSVYFLFTIAGFRYYVFGEGSHQICRLAITLVVECNPSYGRVICFVGPEPHLQVHGAQLFEGIHIARRDTRHF